MKLPSEVPGLFGSVAGHGERLLQAPETRLVREKLAAARAAPSSGLMVNQVEALEERVAERARGAPIHQGVFDDHRTAAISVPLIYPIIYDN